MPAFNRAMPAPYPATSSPPSPKRWALGVGLLVVFAATTWFGFAVAGYHHPAFGFTRFFQLEREFAATALPEVRHGRVFVYERNTGYDGQFYGQLALRPSLRDPALHIAIDNPPLRARRILGSWIAALVGRGDATLTLHAYAWVNLVAWVLLGAILLRLFPPHSAHNLIAWLGLMGSCGVLTSVRYALTDLPALVLIAAALLALERRKWPGYGAAAFMATAALARETAIFAGAALLPGDSTRHRLGRAALLVLPLALWMLYVYLTLGRDLNSLRNFAWPLSAWWHKAVELAASLPSANANRYDWFSAACWVSLTVQVLVVALRPRWREAAWQIGIGYVGLFAILGWPTFEGFPSAYTRILLPLHLVFCRLVPPTRRGLALLVLGNLSVFGGIAMLSDGGKFDHEYAAAKIGESAYVVEEGQGWFGIERDKNHYWTWTPGEASIRVRRFPQSEAEPTNADGVIRFTLTGFVPAEVILQQGDRTLWTGEAPLAGRTLRVPLDDLRFDANDEALLTLTSTTPPAREAAHADARLLCFAVYDLVLERGQ